MTTKVVKLKTVDADTKAEQLSPARLKLRDLQERQAAHRRKSSELEIAARRLDGIVQLAADTKTSLDNFDRRSIAAAAEWAKSALRPTAPEVDVDERQRLLIEHSVAAQNASAARAARDGLTHEKAIEDRAIQDIEVAIDAAVADVIAEEILGPRMTELRDAVALAIAKQHVLKQGLDAIFSIARGHQLDRMKQTFVLGERIHETLRTTMAPPQPDTGPASAAWSRFAAQLSTDATAQFTD